MTNRGPTPEEDRDRAGADGVPAALLSRIVERLRPLEVWLFGSRAEERPRRDSDWDLLVVMPDETPDERLSARAGFEAKRGCGIAADVILCRRATVERRRHKLGPISRAAWTRGRKVYG
ncbi:MAG: nucleotidyltransferase domain-containing protein [Pseudomonadota bacterium]